MIILADVRFFDAFSYAKISAGGIDHITYCRNISEISCPIGDIFSEKQRDEVCFISGIDTHKCIDIISKLEKSFKTIIIWNSNFESLEKSLTLYGSKFKYISLPKYIDIKSNILQSSGLSSTLSKKIIEDLSLLPISERMLRDNVSSIVHKIGVVYGGSPVSCNVADLILGVPASTLDMTNAFCKSDCDFIDFCYYHFNNNKDCVNSQITIWIGFINRFLMSGGDISHSLHSNNMHMSTKLSEMINQKLIGIIKDKDILFCSLCWTHIMSMSSFGDIVLSIASVRSCLSGKLSKKNSINIIKNL